MGRRRSVGPRGVFGRLGDLGSVPGGELGALADRVLPQGVAISEQRGDLLRQTHIWRGPRGRVVTTGHKVGAGLRDVTA